MVQKKAKTNAEFHHQEDLANKLAVQVFGKELLPYLGVEGELRELIPTESIDLSVIHTFSDFNYWDEKDEIVHLEFQSSNTGREGLRDNRIREAVLSKQYNTGVTTYVVYSGNIKNPMTQIEEGINVYRVRGIILTNYDAEEVLQRVKGKLGTGEAIERQEVISLLLTPLMGGEIDQYERIHDSFHILEECQEVLDNGYEIAKYQAILYTFATKFLDRMGLDKLKEVISMSYLGDWLMEEGVERGIKRGMERGMKRGMKRGKKEKEKEIIYNLLQMEMPYEQIAAAVKVGLDYVEELAQKLQAGEKV